jgi:hypothetical protein
MQGQQIVEGAGLLQHLPSPIVFDHTARIPQPAGVNHHAFGLVLKLLDTGRTWVKLSGAYMDTRTGPPTYADVGEVARAYVKAAPERMSGAATGHTRPNMRTRSPTTRFCSTSWLIGRRTMRSEIAFWSTIRRRSMGSIEARSRADISSAVRGLEAADRFRKKCLRQPKHRFGEKDREGDRDEEDHVDRQRRSQR